MVFCGLIKPYTYCLWYTGIVEPANFSDNFTKSGVRVYNASDDVARGMKETAEQVGKKASKEFRQEASEQLAKYSDDVAKGAKEAGEKMLPIQVLTMKELTKRLLIMDRGLVIAENQNLFQN